MGGPRGCPEPRQDRADRRRPVHLWAGGYPLNLLASLTSEVPDGSASRHVKEDFDYLVVCSDETVGSDRDDPAMRCVADLGVKPTTDAAQIGEFLAKRRSRPALVISTHQSCDRVAKGQATAKKKFGLTICDEAHRLVGRVDGHFATVLDDREIRSHRRLFVPPTPRSFTQRAKDRQDSVACLRP